MSDLERPIFGVADWKELAQKGEAPSDAALRKAYSTEVKEVEGGSERAIDFVISTGAVDREGDTIDPTGGDWTGYLNGGSGPVLFGHQYHELPVAYCTSISASEAGIIARAEFPTREELGIPEGTFSMSETVFRMVKGNLGLNSASVGILPRKWSFNEERKDSLGWPGVDFEEWEGLEWSVVSVPANSDAVAIMRGLDIDPAPLWYWARKALDTNDELSVVGTKHLELLVASIGHPSGMEIFDMNADELEESLDAEGGRDIEVEHEPADKGTPDDIIDALEGAVKELRAESKGAEGAIDTDPAADNEAPQTFSLDDLRQVVREELNGVLDGESEMDIHKHVTVEEIGDILSTEIKDRSDRESLKRFGTLAN
jgi:hypothetical protein